jgi:hypothetical protein
MTFDRGYRSWLLRADVLVRVWPHLRFFWAQVVYLPKGSRGKTVLHKTYTIRGAPGRPGELCYIITLQCH